MPVEIKLTEVETTRRCGDCQLCCRLVPVKDLGKAAGERCRHQRHGKGCVVHARLERVSPSCGIWSCRWLTCDDTEALRRPDRSHYCIDPMPDFITIRNDKTGERRHVEAVQIWVDPRYPDAHRDPALRAYLLRRGEEGKVGLVRFSNARGLVIFPPMLASDGEWHEEASGLTAAEHSFADVIDALAGAT